MNNEPERLEGNLIYTRRAAGDKAHPVLFWFLAFVDAFILFAALYFAVLPMSQPYAITNSQQAVAVAAAGASFFGGIILIWRMKQHDAMQWSEREYAPPATPEVAPVPDFDANERRELSIRTTRGNAVIVQPRPGAFASWLKDVLNPDTKITFSKNEAKRRDWEDWQYINLVAQLKGIGWLHETRLMNGAPDINTENTTEIREWQKTPLL